MKKKIDDFFASAEDGREFHISIYVEIIPAGTLTAPSATAEGLKSAKTDEGYHCNFIDENSWKIVELDLEVKRI